MRHRFSHFENIKRILRSEVDFPVSKTYYTPINIFNVTENWKRWNFYWPSSWRSLYIAGVAKVVPGMRQICLSFTNSCVPFYCFIWNNHSSPVDNEVDFNWFSIEIWDTNWEISKIFCDKVGTWHKTEVSAPNSLQNDPNYAPRALHGGTDILQMWKRSKTKLPANCSQWTKKPRCKGGYFYSDIFASLCGGHITFSAPRNPPAMIVSEWNVVTDVIIISSPCRIQVMT